LNWPDPPGAGPLGDGRYASAVERPDTPEALAEAIARRVGEGFAIYPQGGATALDYGGVPGKPGVIVDTRALDRVIDYPAADMTITVEAGLTLAALQRVLSEYRQRLPLDAPQPDRATLGGIFATNASGPRRFGAGRPRDLIIGASFAAADGSLLKGGGRVVKNVAGYDFPRLLTGSLGTLGVIAQMTLKVRPTPEASALIWVPFHQAEPAARALERLNTSGTRPIALELLNGPGARRAGESLGLPEEWFQEWNLVVGFEDNAASVSWQVDRLMMELGRTDVIILEGEKADPLWSGLADFPAIEAGTVAIQANVKPSTVVPLLDGLDPSHWAVSTHAGSGIVQGHWIGEPDLETLIAEIGRLRAEAARDGGSVILPRCTAEWKGRLKVWGEPRGDWALAAKVKAALDPAGVMNPGGLSV
jgi:glycolate oxidase FAD binding subunit